MTTRKSQDYHVKGLPRMDLCGSLRAQEVSGSSLPKTHGMGGFKFHHCLGIQVGASKL